MIPPVTDSDLNVTVQFEPLPEIIRPSQSEITGSSANANAAQLRPKIAQIGHERLDSDDEGDTLTNEMLLLQERVKLEKILCKQ